MWLPQILKGFSGLSNVQVGFLNSIPYLAATVSMVLAGRHSDKTGERRWHVAAGAFAAAAGFFLSAMTGNLLLALAGLVLAFSGLKAMLGPFWAFNTAAAEWHSRGRGNRMDQLGRQPGRFHRPDDRRQAPSRDRQLLGRPLHPERRLLLMGLLALMLREPEVRDDTAPEPGRPNG